MDCYFTEKISLLIDEELPREEARQLENHLAICGECQQTRADFLNLRSQFVDFPLNSRPVVSRKELNRILGKEKVRPANSGWRWVFTPVFVTVACLVIFGVVISLLLYPRLRPAPDREDALAGGQRKQVSPPPVPTPSKENVRKTERQNKVAPRHTQSPSTGEKSRQTNKKSTPVVVEPPQDNIARNNPVDAGPPRPADAETMTAIHFQKSELLLRSFRNVRLQSSEASPELSYEKKLAQQLVYQNMILRREADASGDAQIASLLESLEPILLDIANLSDKPRKEDVRVIRQRVERKNIVALLQVNSTALARALD